MKTTAIRSNLLPLLLGLFSFLIVVGPNALYPTNLAWLVHGDPATHYLGWLFYRYSEWSFPLGLNPNYGLELSNAIIFSDSNPLFAFIFKPFSSFLPESFQYFGIWLAFCFILQAWFGWKLVGLISENVYIRICGTGLFVFAPPMIWRLHGHLSLVGHFLILAALYLTLRPDNHRRLLYWAAVLIVAALVHAYLLAMVGVLWLADIVWHIIRRETVLRNFVGEFLVLLAAVSIACWQAGYFSVGAGVISGGYGYFRMNLFSIIDPSSWSYVLKDIPQARGDYEGFNYLGLGVIALILFSIPTFVSQKEHLRLQISKRPILLIALAGLALFALTNKIGIGTFGFEYPISSQMEKLANIFRASGRMFWPVFYMIIFLVIFLVVRSHDKSIAVALLIIAFALQVIDTSAGWRPIRAKLMASHKSEWDTSLQNPFWAEAARKYTKVKIIPPGNRPANWQQFASYAGIHKMGTDAVYLGRVSIDGLAKARANAATMLEKGALDTNTLYILGKTNLLQVAAKIDSNIDLLANVDGSYVLAPGWKQCRECSKINEEIHVIDLLNQLRLRLGERVQFTNSGSGSAYLVSGWSSPERWGTWSDGHQAEILLPIPARSSSILLEANPLTSPSHQNQRIEIRVNGVPAFAGSLSKNSERKIVIPIPDTVKQKFFSTGGILQLEFSFPDAARPKDIGINNTGTRTLALGLRTITIF